MCGFRTILSIFALYSTFFVAWATPLAPTSLKNFRLPDVPIALEPSGDEHVIILGVKAPHASEVLRRINLTAAHHNVRHVFNNSAFRGFSAHIESHAIDALGQMGDILHVERTVPLRSHSASGQAVRPLSPWGLQRISSTTAPFGNPESLSYTYTYASNSTLGKSVDIYIVDTGINTANIVFGGRAHMGFSFTKNDADLDGHGTHVSGTAAGNIFGVASGANLIGVKVLGADGSGSTADAIAGMDYVINAHNARRGHGGSFAGSIASMSWGLTSVSGAIQTVVAAALAHGVHVSMAAGNDGANACSYSPSAAGGPTSAAMSVGSIGPDATISSFSNTGSCVDLYAPGEDVLSAWIGGDNVVNYLSGTSMACPHVTGVMAYLIAADESGYLGTNPRALKDKILGMALKGVVQGYTQDGDTKLLLNNGMVGQIASDVRLGKANWGGRNARRRGNSAKNVDNDE